MKMLFYLEVLLFIYCSYKVTRYFLWGRMVCRSKERLDGKTVVITGGNDGIGKETAMELARRGARLIMACRNVQKAEAVVKEIQKKTGNANVHVKELDLADFSSVRRCANTISSEEPEIHVLINNAGLVGPMERETTKDGHEVTLQVNYLGHFLFTNLLLKKLKTSAPSRIINVSSLVYSWLEKFHWDDLNLAEKNSYDFQVAYRQSKVANILFTNALAERLKDTGVTSVSLHPGYVMTGIFNPVLNSIPLLKPLLNLFMYLFFMTPKEGAQTTIYCAVAKDIENENGQYFSYMYTEKLTGWATGKDAPEKLWKISKEMVKLGKTD